MINMLSAENFLSSRKYLFNTFKVYSEFSLPHAWPCYSVAVTIYCLQRQEPETQAPDFAHFVCFLQTIGFDLHRIESLHGSSPIHASGQGDASYSVDISCAHSGLRAVLRPRSRTEASAITNSDPTVRQVRIWAALPMAWTVFDCSNTGVELPKRIREAWVYVYFVCVVVVVVVVIVIVLCCVVALCVCRGLVTG
jgi:hypothetical protein